jgi:S-sulfo-L-cysteine synthase (3-phospho-L-serine-dependent)
MRFDSVIDAIGHTPAVRLRVPAAGGVEVYAKLELQNQFAMKDRVAKQIVLEARRDGTLAPGAPLIESSSGTMALGLALVGTHLGHPVHIVTDPRIDEITLAKLEALGCTVHVVRAMTGQGWQSARLERLAQLMADLDGAFWPRQYTNPQNPAAYRALAGELRADLGHLDVLVGSVGSGGSLCGTSRALLPGLPGLRVVGVDCVGSAIFAQPDWPQRRQSGLGNSLHPGNVDYALIDEVHWLSDDEAFDATRRLAAEQQIFAGNTSGSVYRVLCHLAARAPAGTRLAGIFPDRGDRYVSGVYRGAPGPVAAEPAEVSYGTPVSSWSYARIPREGRPRFVFVEANTTGTGMLALSAAAWLGTTPVFLTGMPGRYAGLDEARCEVVGCDTNDPAALRQAVLSCAAGPGGLAGIATTSEFYLEPVAALGTELGLAANPAEAMRTCRDKARTRAALAAAGIHQPRFQPVGDPAEVPGAVAAVGLPCVVKPADDSGSVNVLLCHSTEEAQAHTATVLAVTTNVRGQPTVGTALVEQYLPDPELSVEMFSVDGEAICVGCTRKTVTGEPYFVEAQHIFPAGLPDAQAADVIGTVTRALAATGVRFGATHVEVKLTPAGCAVVEINARLAGGMIPELIRLATGVDLLEQHVRAFAGLPVRLAPARSRYAGIRFLLAPSPGRLTGITGAAAARTVPGVESVVFTTPPGTVVRPPRSAYDRLGHVIASGDSAHEVEATLEAAAGHLRVQVAAEAYANPP